MRMPNHLLLAWLAPALAFSLMFVAWMFVTVTLEGAVPPLKGYFRVGLLAFGSGLIIQLIYGGFLYITLFRAGLLQWWAVLIAYVLPVLLFSWWASDTMQDILGTLPWLVFTTVVALLSWFLVSPRWFSWGPA